MRQQLLGLLAVAFSLSGCADEEDHPPALETGITEGNTSPSRPRPRPVADDDGGPGANADDDADGGIGVPANCGSLTCRGHGACAIVEGLATCVCDFGYVAEGDGDEFECILDESCRRLRPLEEKCRQIVGGAPAVAAFFAVDYCAGPAVLPEDLGDLDEAFDIYEDGQNILDNEESVAAVIERDVESYVAIALDVSKSVTGVESDTEKQRALTALIREVRNFVEALRAQSNQPPVTVSLLVFGRFVEEYLPYTTDLDAVDKALARIESNPDEVVDLVGGDGTALFEAVARGIDSVERIQSLRNLVTSAGVLSTGTLVVITDGRDSSNAELNQARVEATRVSLISIGISGDIDDADLGAIGRDGSFLAPAPEDWSDAFAEIAQRVAEYPERAYLLAYCSSATSGEVNVSVGLRGEGDQVGAGCFIDADAFSTDPAARCNLELFDRACDGLECGTFFACGACPNQQCCSEDSCQAPAATPKCRDQDALCAAEGLVCTEVDPQADIVDRFACDEPYDEGDDCSKYDYCEPGKAYCQEVAEDVFACVPVTLENGDACGVHDDFEGARCPDGNCSQKGENNATDPFECRREARIFERCATSTADARCEAGAVCDGAKCAARELWSCNKNEDCLSGACDTDTKLCVPLLQCPFDWNSKVPAR